MVMVYISQPSRVINFEAFSCGQFHEKVLFYSVRGIVYQNCRKSSELNYCEDHADGSFEF